MKKALSLLAVSFVACLLGLGPVGCSKKAEKKEAAPKASIGDVLTAEVGAITFDKKESSRIVGFSNRIAWVKSAEADMIKATVADGGRRIIIRQVGESPDNDRDVLLTVKGGKDDKEEVKIRVTVKKKGS